MRVLKRVAVPLASFAVGLGVTVGARGRLSPATEAPPTDADAAAEAQGELATAAGADEPAPRDLLTEPVLELPRPFSAEELQALADRLQAARAHHAGRARALEEERQALEVLGRELDERRADLEAVMRALDEERLALEAGRAELARERVSFAAGEEDALRPVAKRFEDMSPDAAAERLGGMRLDTAAKVLGLMRSRKASKVLEAIASDRAVELTQRLAAMRRPVEEEEVP